MTGSPWTPCKRGNESAGIQGWRWASRFSSGLLLPLLGGLILLPLLFAFKPLLDGGLLANLGRAVRDTRFVNSFAFGIKQALASCLLSLALGLPAAFLLARRRFPGKRLLAALAAVPFTVPALIVGIGFVLYYGRNGYLNRLLMDWLSLDQPPLTFLYSFGGVILAHGFYNFPLVMRFVADAWERVPLSQAEAARLLGASEFRIFRTITLPSIGPAIGSAASLTFLLCFFSFVIVMLFAGPGVATPEVELYRAARFDFDLPLASAFALAETILALSLLALYAWFENKHAPLRLETAPRQPASAFRTRAGRWAALAFALVMVVFLGGPLLAIGLESFDTSGRRNATVAGTGHSEFGVANYRRLLSTPHFGQAALNTLLLGLLCATLAGLVGFGLHLAVRRSRATTLTKVLPMLPLAISGVVLSYGWTSLLQGSSLLVIALVQTVSVYPFIFKAIQSSLGKADERYSQAAQTLGSSRWTAALRVSLPLALPALLSGMAFAFAISAGDATAQIVAPVSGFETMASYLYRLAGSYRFSTACAVAVLLSILTGLIFLIKDYSHDAT